MQQNQETITVTLTDDDLANLVAFGNRAQMNGAEADTWVALKQRLIEARRQLHDTSLDVGAGGTA